MSTRPDGPAITLRGPWLASAQQAERAQSDAAALSRALAERDARLGALVAQLDAAEAAAAGARSETRALGARLAHAEAAASSAALAAARAEVDVQAVAADLPLFENVQSILQAHFKSLQAKWQAAEHGRQLAEVTAASSANELERMTKLHISSSQQAGSLKQKLRSVEDELVEARRRASEQARHAQVLQRERERLNGLITECRRQMASLQAASKAQAAAYAQRKAGGAAKAEAARAEAEAAANADPLLAFSATARWTGAAGAAAAADAVKPDAAVPSAATPGADAAASPSTPSGSRADAQLSASKTVLGSAAREPHAKARLSPPPPSSLGSARHANAVRARLFGAGGDDGAPTLPPQDNALVSLRPAGLAPAARFRNWARASPEEREAALQAENAELLTALQTQLARCGALEASVAALRAENVQLRYSKPAASTPRAAVVRPQSAGRARPRTPAAATVRAPTATTRVVAEAHS